jgi:hypothetical protein
MKVGDLVKNFHAIGISDTWRPSGGLGVIIKIVPSVLELSFGTIESTDLLVLYQDGTVSTYGSAAFKVITPSSIEHL